MWCSGGIRAIQGGKCDQPTQCLNRHGIKQHSAYWFLKRHSPWVIWICHLMPFNHRKYHLKLYQSDWDFFRSYAMHSFSSYSIWQYVRKGFKQHSLQFGVGFYFFYNMFLLFSFNCSLSFSGFHHCFFLIFSFSFLSASFLAVSVSIFWII